MSLQIFNLDYLFILYSNILYITLFLFFANFLVFSFLKFKTISFYFNISSSNYFKISFIYIFTVNMILILIKLAIQLFFMKTWLLFLISHTSNLNITSYYVNYFLYGIYTNNLGYSLLFLCYITTMLTLYYLGDRDLFTKGTSLFYFTFFLVCTTIMVTSSNLLVIFLSFEFIFLPSLYFVYTLGYVKKVDKTIYYLLLWTLLGSFLVLFGFAYTYTICKTLDYKLLIAQNFSSFEKNYLYFIFFLGFSIKIPIFPFHYWLTKVHVEAPAGFSMFLSGFLVKTALYCFYYLNLLFSTPELRIYFILWISLCIVEASIKMWVQVDIKKLIAFATIQEMNMLLLSLLLLQSIYTNIIILFIIMHGILSTLMFFLVDQVQKRAQTRNILLLSGFGTRYPLLRLYIWFMLIFYLGLPLTIKFVIEWHIGSLLALNLNFFGMLIFFFALFFGAVGFTKCWLHILYGQPSLLVKNLKSVDMLYKDRLFVYILSFILISLNFFIIFI